MWNLALGTVMNLANTVASGKSAIEMLHKHWHKTAVVTGAFQPKLAKKVSKEKLLPGELAAVTFKVGCYKVRSSKRVYNRGTAEDASRWGTPASKEDVELVRKSLDENGQLRGFDYYSWDDRLRIVNEISAKYCGDSDAEYVPVCYAEESTSFRWYESVSCICAAKKALFAPDHKASLLVCVTYTGDSYGTDSWYKLSPSGKLERLYLHPYDSDMDDAKFEPIEKM